MILIDLNHRFKSFGLNQIHPAKQIIAKGIYAVSGIKVHTNLDHFVFIAEQQVC